MNERYSNIPGITVTYFGNTPRTKLKNECGMAAIGEL